MIKTIMFFISTLLVLGILALSYQEADAASRFGGGKSFGGKSSFSQPFSKPAPSMTTPKANAAPGVAGAAAPGRGGLFGGMGGMLGGLLAGGLIGSLLFGGGGGGGGFLDIIIIGLLAFLAFKFFTRRKTNSDQPNPNLAPVGPAHYSAPDDAWANLRDTPPSQATAFGSTAAPNIPANFNQEEFLAGAKAAYTRMNASWDKRDLADIAQFTTPSFLSEINQQAKDDPNPSTTEIMLVNASLVEVLTENNEETASVYFDVLMRENQTETAPHDVREVWHFTRPLSGGNWKLDGIQQTS